MRMKTQKKVCHEKKSFTQSKKQGGKKSRQETQRAPFRIKEGR